MSHVSRSRMSRPLAPKAVVFPTSYFDDLVEITEYLARHNEALYENCVIFLDGVKPEVTIPRKHILKTLVHCLVHKRTFDHRSSNGSVRSATAAPPRSRHSINEAAGLNAKRGVGPEP
eukprot:scaffold289058_cov31-Tisochrysis_lutea.AAC.4